VPRCAGPVEASTGIRPGFLRYELRLPAAGSSRVFMTACLSLLPGTLSVQLEDDYLVVHTLDRAEPNRSRIRTLEDHVADLYGAS
jgi:multicomponent Na+:H+ antiporter subunit E